MTLEADRSMRTATRPGSRSACCGMTKATCRVSAAYVHGGEATLVDALIAGGQGDLTVPGLSLNEPYRAPGDGPLGRKARGGTCTSPPGTHHTADAPLLAVLSLSARRQQPAERPLAPALHSRTITRGQTRSRPTFHCVDGPPVTEPNNHYSRPNELRDAASVTHRSWPSRVPAP